MGNDEHTVEQFEVTIQDAIQRLGSHLWKYVWDVRSGTQHYVVVRTIGYENMVWGDSLRECIEKAEAWIEETECQSAELIAGVRWEE